MTHGQGATGVARLLTLAASGCFTGGMLSGVGSALLAVVFVLDGAWAPGSVTLLAGLGFSIIHHVLGLSGMFTADEHAKQWGDATAAGRARPSLLQWALLLLGSIVLLIGVVLPLAGTAAGLAVALQGETWWSVAFATGGIPCGTLAVLLGFALVGAVEDRRLALARAGSTM
ncbi:hypothetical protein EHW97_01865 [Aeromicrobium camelliae]|uniref:Uncharacterized protein n=1 Tax=Aeromicrobium camelliae TaxID=1538144 RepID=A0A3N6ZRC4_9ACTN|nr:hypothetical protein [Aeromicrobium camelliae]RQN09617.1 hypothetical protein EHW97_01865 [Aeromicrobium camelliae]